jgi:hypothetical protein
LLTGALSEAPHSPQNFAVGALSAPHRKQPRGSTVPHSEQNFLLAVFSVPHFKQRIASPCRDCGRLVFLSPSVRQRPARLRKDATACWMLQSDTNSSPFPEISNGRNRPEEPNDFEEILGQKLNDRLHTSARIYSQWPKYTRDSPISRTLFYSLNQSGAFRSSPEHSGNIHPRFLLYPLGLAGTRLSTRSVIYRAD